MRVDISSRSRLSIDIPSKERLMLKMLALSQNRTVNDFVLSCIREHLLCNKPHVPNKKTAAVLRESARDHDSESFDSPEDLFKHLGLPTICLDQSPQRNLKKTSKKRVAKKKI